MNALCIPIRTYLFRSESSLYCAGFRIHFFADWTGSLDSSAFDVDGDPVIQRCQSTKTDEHNIFDIPDLSL